MVFSQVYTHEDEDREQDVPNDDDNLSDIKEDLVDESNNGRPGSAGEKSDADDKTGKNISRVTPLSRDYNPNQGVHLQTPPWKVHLAPDDDQGVHRGLIALNINKITR